VIQDFSSLDRFEAERPRLRALAYRMLGSSAEADDAVQEAWLRFDRTDLSEVENLAAWLTTVVSRVCLNLLRARQARREESLESFTPDWLGAADEDRIPQEEAELADSVDENQCGPAGRVMEETARQHTSGRLPSRSAGLCQNG
jgi:RNA polymerase sigma factor (sigma-70 family)